MGQAVVASAIGSEALWWNPALVARSVREAGFHAAKSPVLDADAAGSLLIPVQRVGTFALGLRYFSEGTLPATDSTGENQTGTLTVTATILAATFASPITNRLALGLTYKLLRRSLDCTGMCTQTGSSQTFALDLGAQYLVTKDSSVALGFALSNAGPKFQVHDASQADPLPARADFGISIAPRLEQMPKEARVRAAADLVTRVSGGYAPGFRFGAELAWLDRYQVRGGYVFNGPFGSGATFGLGFSTGKLQIDLARVLSNAVSTADSPTYLSLRYLF
jgi:type IX secretion system protein PorV